MESINKNIFYDFDDLMKINENNKDIISSKNWKEIFTFAKFIIRSNSAEKLNCLLFLKKLVNKINHTDFEIKLLFNEILEELVMLMNNSDTLITNLVKKIFVKLSKNTENVEYIVRHTIISCLENDDWNIRYSSILVLKLIIDEKMEFFTEKPNYAKKIIESLVIHTKDNSEIASSLATEVIVKFISNLTNYNELTKSLNPTLLKEIYDITNRKRSDNLSSIKNIINNSTKSSTINISEMEYKNKKTQEYYIDANGFIFGIFPKTLIWETDMDLSIELRIESFEKIRDIFEQNLRNPSFLKFSNSFFKFISKYLNDKLSSVSLISLHIINSMLATISGVNLFTNIHQSIHLLVEALGSQMIQIRQKVKEVFNKIVMIIPTSQLLPYFLQSFKSENWIVISESLDYLYYIFSNLKSIYNDIDFSEKKYDVTYFLEVVNLFDHPVNKVVNNSKKFIKLIGNEVIETNKFLTSMEYYLSNELYRSVQHLFENRIQSEEPNFKVNDSTNTNRNFHDYDVATARIINKLENFNQFDHNEDRNNVDNPNFIIYNKITKYEDQNMNENINVDEDLMDGLSKNILDEKGRIKSSQPQKNYQNYENKNEKNNLKKLKKSILKTRLKRYNDPDETNLEEYYDKNYVYDYKPKETLSPLKYPDSVYQNIYSGLKSNLNWEKQYKNLDSLRKIIYYHSKTLNKDFYFTNLIIDEVLNLTSSIRSSLVKNALVTLSELFQCETINISSKYDDFLRVLTKKIFDKNQFISQEASRSLNELLLNCDPVKLSTAFFETAAKNNFKDNIIINIDILSKLVYFHEKKFVSNNNFNKTMNYVTEIFHKYKNHIEIKQSLKEYFMVLRKYFNNEEKFENFLKKYYGNETLNKILQLTYDDI